MYCPSSLPPLSTTTPWSWIEKNPLIPARTSRIRFAYPDPPIFLFRADVPFIIRVCVCVSCMRQRVCDILAPLKVINLDHPHCYRAAGETWAVGYIEATLP